MPHLTTVPTFTFNHVDPFIAEGNSEYPITVSYYNGCISFDQNDNSITISNDHIKALFKETIKHLPEATQWLERSLKD